MHKPATISEGTGQRGDFLAGGTQRDDRGKQYPHCCIVQFNNSTHVLFFLLLSKRFWLFFYLNSSSPSFHQEFITSLRDFNCLCPDERDAARTRSASSLAQAAAAPVHNNSLCREKNETQVGKMRASERRQKIKSRDCVMLLKRAQERGLGAVLGLGLALAVPPAHPPVLPESLPSQNITGASARGACTALQLKFKEKKNTNYT